MKKLFKNYTFQFDKNEKKLLTSFSKQVLKQVEGDSRYYSEAKVFNSLLDKLNDSTENIKLTKEEKTRLTHQLEENVKFLKKKISSSWFLMKWVYGSLLNQYQNLLSNHFKD